MNNNQNEDVNTVNTEKVPISAIKPKWTEKDGVIRFSVTSDYVKGEEWIARLRSKDLCSGCSGDYLKSILRSDDFKPTSGYTYEIAILKSELFSDDERTTENIREEAEVRKLSTPNAEIACLIREKFSAKELEVMGLSFIVVMHEPIKDCDGDLSLLRVSHRDDVSRLVVGSGYPERDHKRDGGFAFVVFRVNSRGVMF